MTLELMLSILKANAQKAQEAEVNLGQNSLFTLSNAKNRESIVIGFAASSTSKGPQVKTTEHMVSIKVTNCSIQLG